ncbi:DEAD/DEAH box helicase [Reinekea forsetii]|uniref:DNA 3'-5' helicase II n=1 Tax=Reinekea forsetii TaxID=1336806 RepID=A0A2K8KQU8_9GAMM|nr:nuclease-related domain-containing DEAD/DEAH box helicase [Reinekea forsetii]ATX77097.1 DNA helicase II related protein [Reinekea forsetii]
MAKLFPSLENINRLTVKPEPGELYLLEQLSLKLSDDFEIYFNPYLDADRPDILILIEKVGVVVIEVKDWNFAHYEVDSSNAWYVLKDGKKHNKKSPHQQALKYKKNLFDLHIQSLGLRAPLNKNFYNLVSAFVYFHNTTHESLCMLYEHSQSDLDNEVKGTNEQFNLLSSEQKPSHFSVYKNKMDYLDRKIRQIKRDISASGSRDSLDKLIGKIIKMKSHILFTDEIYQDFKRRLDPPDFVKSQGVDIVLDRQQKLFSISTQEHAKIKGVAGCGKSTIIAARAVDALFRHGGSVLILTFNLSLRPYLRDKVAMMFQQRKQDISPDDIDRIEFNKIEITNYHQFFYSQLNNIEKPLEGLDGGVSSYSQKERLDKEYKNRAYFENEVDLFKYDTILIDEIQDFESEWVKIVRDFFLRDEGEIVLFGDQSQNIYKRNQKEREAVIAQGFGRWKSLKKSYRHDASSPLLSLYEEFQSTYLLDKYDDVDKYEISPTQMKMNFDLIRLKPYLDGECAYAIGQFVATEIKKSIKDHDLVPNDIAVLCSDIRVLRVIEQFIGAFEHTKVTFTDKKELLAALLAFKITEQEYDGFHSSRSLMRLSKDVVARCSRVDDALEKLSRAKKIHFYQNSGNLKMSTIHSFKGLECKTVFCVLLKNDDDEIVYTSITRSKSNLFLFLSDKSQYGGLFSRFSN